MFAALLSTDGGPLGHLLQDSDGATTPADASQPVAMLHGGAARFERLEDHYWIAGAIRLDARAELRAKLGLVDESAGDAALCVHAYRRWGEDFADHLAGDFAFALWDGGTRRLLAVRDQLGIRSLFYARYGACWCVADSLDWLAARPAFDDRLDEAWIGDFLATGLSLDAQRTVYRAIRRVPPGHCVELGRDLERLRRYWRLTVERPLFLRDGEYGERFRSLTTLAIRDRAPPGRLGIAMSGGLDSTTLAALSVEALGEPGRITARCAHFETLMADDEPRFASMAAQALGIELHFDPVDCAYDPLWRERGFGTPEPTIDILNAHNERAIARGMAADAGVWFWGEGPDNALIFDRGPYLAWLLRTGRWMRATRAAWRYLGLKIDEQWHEKDVGQPAAPAAPPAIPPWIRRDLVVRTDLQERARAVRQPPSNDHPWHPRALGSFGTPAWQALLERCAADEAGAGLVWRHPYLDLRVLGFLLSVPPVPWARRKLVIRQAMTGRLPEPLLRRRKTPLSANPMASALRGRALPALDATELDRWVDLSRLPTEPGPAELDALLLVHALDYWLG